MYLERQPSPAEWPLRRLPIVEAMLSILSMLACKPVIELDRVGIAANPHNPYSAVATIRATAEVQVHAEVRGPDGWLPDTPSVQLAPGELGEVLILGLEADAEYDVQLVADIGDEAWTSPSLPFETERTADGLAPVVGSGSLGEPDELVCTNTAKASGAVYVCFDGEGTVRWSLEHPDGTNFLALEPLSDGGFATVTESSQPRLARFDERGALVDELSPAWIDARTEFRHTWIDVHEVIELREGPWAGAVAVLTGVSDTTPVGERLGNGIAVVDLAVGEVLWDWSSHGVLGDDVPIDPLLPYDRSHPTHDPVDWQHANALVHGLDPDGSQFFWMSLRHQDWIVKIDVQTGAVDWRFGQGGDFDGIPEDGWMYGQHAPQLVERDGDRITLAVFDNGNVRRDATGAWDLGAEPWSRAVVFELDEGTMQAAESFSVGWPDPEFFSAIRGDADLLDADTLQYLSSWPGSPEIVRVSVPDGAEIWRAELADGAGSYRARTWESVYER